MKLMTPAFIALEFQILKKKKGILKYRQTLNVLISQLYIVQ